MTCRNILAQIQPRSGGGVKEGVGLHSQDLWMVGINRQINAGVPIATALIAFLKQLNFEFLKAFKAQSHICYVPL